jgi:hypothetical protein
MKEEKGVSREHPTEKEWLEDVFYMSDSQSSQKSE